MKIIFYPLLVLLWTVRSFSQGVDTLTVEACVQKAIAHHPLVKLASERVNEFSLRHARLAREFLPGVTLHGIFHHLPESGYDPILTNGGEYALQSGVAYTALDFGRRSAVKTQASVGVTIASLELRIAEEKLRREVRLAYLDLFESQQAVSLQREGIAELSEYVKLVQRLQRGGVASEADVLAAKIELAQMQAQLNSTEARLWQASVQLRSLMDEHGNRMTVARELPLFDLPDTVKWDASLTLEKLLEEIRFARASTDFAQAEKYPMVNVFGDVGWLSSNILTMNKMFGFSVGISVDGWLWRWGAESLNVQVARSIEEQRKLDYESQRLSLASSVQELLIRKQAARMQYEQLASSVSDATDAFILSKARFAGGIGSNLDVLTAHRRLIDLRLSVLRSRVEEQRLATEIQFLSATW
ncbi:MAG: TolC family protein [Bacteroidota bacterium]